MQGQPALGFLQLTRGMGIIVVNVDITPSGVDIVVRFKRTSWSEMLGRDFWDTDLIILVATDHEADLRRDLSTYRQLPTPEQLQFIAELREKRYTGRMLADAVPESAVEPATPQLGLFQ